jgi:hypothetical protein
MKTKKNWSEKEVNKMTKEKRFKKYKENVWKKLGGGLWIFLITVPLLNLLNKINHGKTIK